MPAPVAAAAVTAAGTLGGTFLQQRGANRAADAQLAAQREAMQYQERQDWRARFDARQQYDNYMRTVYGDQYRPNGPAPEAAPVAPVAAPVVAPVAAPVAAPVVTAPEVPPPLTGVPVTGPRSLADLDTWSASNYSRYLGGRR